MNTCKWIFKLSKYVDKYKHKASRYLGQEEHTCGSNFNPWRLQICLTCHIESSWIHVPYKSFKQKISKNHKTLDIHSTNNAIFAILGPLSHLKFYQMSKNSFISYHIELLSPCSTTIENNSRPSNEMYKSGKSADTQWNSSCLHLRCFRQRRDLDLSYFRPKNE